jgi:hypothetical protein
MAKLTRKLWVGIGAATLAGAPVAGGAMAQDAHKSHTEGSHPQPARPRQLPRKAAKRTSPTAVPPIRASASTATSH